ncbi:DUF4166 domain-containing protein [Halothiobacillus sp.]|jgi:hypothetical protein|uniref:DUF4166 domain-containing protein n=1 Tax=Halothiobacillus sp. TaxID=1891311 RepID=UPI002AD204EC|nr:DUF4166 domain-containing protein [Halothiobacillus sp.]
MSSLMQRALGEDWDKLPPALQTHYQFGVTTDTGHMDIEYPRFMQGYLSVLRVFGALVNRRGHHLPTVVEKKNIGERQYWRRTITYPDGKTVCFNSFWISAGDNHLIEFVNPVLGLQMAVHVQDGALHYRGVRFIVKLGPLRLPIPEWLVLGHTSIEEKAVDDTHFTMDFRLTHPLLGQVFRYAGVFAATSE